MRSQRYCVALTAVDVDYALIRQCVNRLDAVLVKDVTTAELAAVPSSPREYDALLTDCCCMVMSERQLDDPMVFQLVDLARHWLLQDVCVAQSAEIAVTPCVDHAISSHCTRVVVPCLDPYRYLTI